MEGGGPPRKRQAPPRGWGAQARVRQAGRRDGQPTQRPAYANRTGEEGDVLINARTHVRAPTIMVDVRAPKGRDVHHPVPHPPPAARRHCWVAGSDDAPGPHARLVIGWERREDGWYAQVAYVIEDEAAVVVHWLPQKLLRLS